MINDKNCSLSIALTAMYQKLQKSYKVDTTHQCKNCQKLTGGGSAARPEFDVG